MTDIDGRKDAYGSFDLSPNHPEGQMSPLTMKILISIIHMVDLRTHFLTNQHAPALLA